MRQLLEKLHELILKEESLKFALRSVQTQNEYQEQVNQIESVKNEIERIKSDIVNLGAKDSVRKRV